METVSATRDEMAATLNYLARRYPEHPIITEDMLDAWERNVARGFSRDELQAGARTWTSTSQEWPTLHQFIATCTKLRRDRSATERSPEEVPPEGPVLPHASQATMARLVVEVNKWANGQEWPTPEAREAAVTAELANRKLAAGITVPTLPGTSA